MNWVEILQIWIMAFVTLALLSFLYKDNPIYKLVEHIFAGLSAGYYVGLIWDTVIVQQLYIPMFSDGKYWLIIPGILGFLMFTRFFPKYSWISRVSLAFFMGTAAGIFLISQLHGLVLPQMQDTMTPRTSKEVVSLDGYGIHLGELEIVDPDAVDTLQDTTLNIDRAEYTVAYGDSVIISSILKDTTGASVEELVVSLKIRQQEIAEEMHLLERGTNETEGLSIIDNGSGSITTQYIFKPDTSYAAGIYDLSYEVKKETIMYPLTILILIGVISTLIYFYFSKEHTGALGVTAKVGIWFIMISFGAHFGYTVMGRVSLLIGRVQFLVEDWLGTFSELF